MLIVDPNTLHCHCSQCDLVCINGVPCHEQGCPDAWQGVPIPCWHCGFDFIPDNKDNTGKYARCPDCLDRDNAVDWAIEHNGH